MDFSIETQVAVIGGGIQGLWLLNDLQEAGIDALLITRSPLGRGQTLHSHLYIHQGFFYTRTDLAGRLHGINRTWNDFLEKCSIPRPSIKPTFAFTIPDSNYWEALWKDASLDYEEVDLPSFLDKSPGELSGGMGRSYRVGEYWLEGAPLMKALTENVANQIIRAETTRIVPEADGVRLQLNHPAQNGGGATSAGEITVRCRKLILAAGAGNQKLIGRATVDDPGNPALAQRHQRLRKSQMFFVAGPNLPQISLMRPNHALFMVCRTMKGAGGEEVPVWLGSYGIDHIASTDSDLEVDRGRLETGISFLSATYPGLRDLAPGLRWGVYTGFKSEGEIKTKHLPSEEVVVRLSDRITAVWPTKLTLAPKASREIVDGIKKNSNILGIKSQSGPAFNPSPYREIAREKWLETENYDWESFKSEYRLDLPF